MKRKRRAPTQAQKVEAAVRLLRPHMRDQLMRAGMDASDGAVDAACRRRLRARLALREWSRPVP